MAGSRQRKFRPKRPLLGRISGADRRTKSSNAGTRVGHALRYGDFRFRLVLPKAGSAVLGVMAGNMICYFCWIERICRQKRELSRSDIWCAYKQGHRRKRMRSGVMQIQAVPGHEAILRVERGGFGGARGCIQRSNVSMMTMRPPQQGQGGWTSITSSAVSGSGGGAASSNARASARLSLRAELASNP